MKPYMKDELGGSRQQKEGSMIRLDFCTVVMPDEYDYVAQFERAMKDANKYHKRHHEECPSPYFVFDAGKVYGLVLDLQRMKAAQQSVHPTAAGGSDSGENSESGGG